MPRDSMSSNCLEQADPYRVDYGYQAWGGRGEEMGAYWKIIFGGDDNSVALERGDGCTLS